MNKIDYASLKKERLLGIMIIVSFFYMIVLGRLHHLLIDQVIIISLLNSLFLIVLLMSIQLERISKVNKYNFTRGHGRFVAMFSLGCILLVCNYFFPNVTEPLLGITLLISLSSSATIGMTCGIYFVMIQTLILNHTTTTAVELLFLVICGASLSLLLQKKRYFLNSDLMIFLLCMCAEIIFHYFSAFEADLRMIIQGMIGGVINIILVSACYPFITKTDEIYYENTLDYLINPNFPLIKDLRACSESLFIHGIQVSKAAGACAKKLHLNEKLALAGGLYYQLGLFKDIQGSFPREIAGMKNQFPSDLLQLIEEYKGENQSISTPESAIVDLIDSVFEHVKNGTDNAFKDSASSSFNQEFVIYKVLNDRSASGIYDKSGFTMNMYITVREYLISEVDFNECFRLE